MFSRRAQWCVLSLFLIAALPARGQSISTVAGGGTDDGRLATDVGIYGGGGLTFDIDGSLLFVERDGNAVRRVNLQTGVITTVAGNGGAGYGGDGEPARFATLRGPSSVALDAAGNIYIADTLNDRIRRINRLTGTISTFAGGGSPPEGWGDGGQATDAALRGPFEMAIHDGVLYFTEWGYNGNCVRKVDLASGIIDSVTLPGTGGFSGDGGPASEAEMRFPLDIVADASGNLFIADAYNDRVRRIDAVTKVITTFAGGGTPADDLGDGLPASQARLNGASSLAIDPQGNLVIMTWDRVRRVSAVTGVISTVIESGNALSSLAIDSLGRYYMGSNEIERRSPPDYVPVVVAGGGRYVGDGKLATNAILRNPVGVAVDASGNLFIADSENLIVRRVDAATKIITTIAGNGGAYMNEPQEGAPAAQSVVGFPLDVAVDPASTYLLISDALNGRVWKVDLAAGTIRTFAGGGGPDDGIGDGGPATEAQINPYGIFIEPSGSVLIADKSCNRIRRVGVNGVIQTVAGRGARDAEGGFEGDGGPALQALFHDVQKAISDPAGNIFISDNRNGRIRKVDTNGIVTTYAGIIDGGEELRDNVPATQTHIGPHYLAFDPQGNLLVTDSHHHRVRKINAQTGIITTLAGSGVYYYQPDFQGDGGPALAARFNFGYDIPGITVDTEGNVFVGDVDNNRVRAIFSCATPGTPAAIAPSAGQAGVSTSATLSWTAAKKAFRYNVYLDTVSPPAKLLASDVGVTSYSTSNLLPGTTYYWRVVALGDPFCTPVLEAASPVYSFTTAGSCDAPAAFELSSPAQGATVTAPVTLSWQPSAGAATYDVYAGNSAAPPLLAAGLTSTSFVVPATSPGTWTWRVVARASCDQTKTTVSSARTFIVAGACAAPGAFSTTAPASGAVVPASATLSWSPSAGASSYDVYLGRSANPPLYASGVSGTSLSLRDLTAGATYSWRVVARVACSSALSASTPVVQFTVQQTCETPGSTEIVFAPPSDVAAGQTYGIAWREVAGLDGRGGYVVERSTSSSFATLDQSQVTTSTSATFVARETGTFHHRVRAIAGCDPAIRGAVSPVRPVRVTGASPNVVFSAVPSAVITSLGERLETRSTSFALENIGTSPVQVIVGKSEINSVPFFTIVDPEGGDVFVTLMPRVPKRFEVRFSGPANDQAGSYQGVIFAAATGTGLSVTPYAFVNLKVGGAAGATPQFFSGGTPVEYVAFPGFAGNDDAGRAPLLVEVRNPGNTPMEVGAEIGPEVWLRLDANWNRDPIPPGGSRVVPMRTQRNRAPNGSSLPRYTWLTVRTRDGASRRLLVQDNPVATISSGRRVTLGLGEPSVIVPEVTSVSTGDATSTSVIRLTNSSVAAVQAELIFTPSGANGVDDPAVRLVTVLVPPNDTVALTDPLVQLFGLARPQQGSLEIRAPRESIGFLAIAADVIRNIAAGGTAGYRVPLVSRGSGLRAGETANIAGIRTGAGVTSRVTLVETTGVAEAVVRLRLFHSNGSPAGEKSITVPRYGRADIADAGVELGAASMSGGRIEVSIESGGGTVAGFAVALDPARGNGLVRSLGEETIGAAEALQRKLLKPAAIGGSSFIIPTAVFGPISASAPYSYQTSVGLVAPVDADAEFALTYVPAGLSGFPVVQSIPVGAGQTRELINVLRDAFALPEGSKGSLLVEGPAGISTYAAVSGSGVEAPAYSAVPVIPSLSEMLTGSGFAVERPLYLDGLDQSLDPAQGRRWLLILNELGGASGSVNVALYEAGNRSRPIAEKEIFVGAGQQVTLDSLFASLDLETQDRRKDRTNMLCVVEGRSGAALVSAVGLSIDVRTGRSEARQFEPAGVTSIDTAAPVTDPTVTRRRPLRR